MACIIWPQTNPCTVERRDQFLWIYINVGFKTSSFTATVTNLGHSRGQTRRDAMPSPDAASRRGPGNFAVWTRSVPWIVHLHDNLLPFTFFCPRERGAFSSSFSTFSPSSASEQKRRCKSVGAEPGIAGDASADRKVKRNGAREELGTRFRIVEFVDCWCALEKPLAS